MAPEADVSASKLSAVKLALLAKQLRARGDTEILAAEPIAIVGLGCRFPGGANDPESFWDLLARGGDGTSEVPVERWDSVALYDPDPQAAGKLPTRRGGFIGDVAGFDPLFFGISPREAVHLDPQQRLMLEVAYEALERAGLKREQLSGSRTGVYLASYNDDYALLQMRDLAGIEAYTGTGTGQAFVANRLSFALNLQGPSITFDTACSSSLVAVHSACQSLRNAECDVALAGGVSLMLEPAAMVAMARWGMLSPDGQCRTFDQTANGFARGEGCGVVILKRLSDALATGDHVLAVVRGSAVNQDGRTSVLTAPNGRAQQAVVRQALANARVEGADIGYVETHGTGTALGDPIEVEALAEVLGSGESPCVLGAVKTNIGHLEAAAGIAGLIKTVLVLQQEAIPPNLHFTTLNPHISLDGTRFELPTGGLRAWPRGDRGRLAGVSSFGAGGTNAHVILEEAPRLPARSPEEDESAETYLLPLSAEVPGALADLAAAYGGVLDGSSPRVADVVYTATRRRSHYASRLAIVGGGRAELSARLAQWRAGALGPGCAAGQASSSQPLRVAFIFSGQGPQWWAMGRELLATEPTFRETVARIDALLQTHTRDWSLLSELNRMESETRLGETAIAQPALFALQVGLAELWHEWGVAPAAVIGHSVGEVAAAYIARALTLDQAVRLVYERGRLMQRATGGGCMAQIELSADAVEQACAAYGARLSIAAVNSPESTVIAGDASCVAEVSAHFQARGASVRALAVNYAFHSAQMAPMQAELERTLDGLSSQPAQLVWVSTVSGEPQTEAPTAAYWGQNVRQTVRFAAAVEALLDRDFDVYLEVGPHPVLGACITATGASRERSVVTVASLRRGRPERQTLLQAAADLWVRGAELQWAKIEPLADGRSVELPTYPWQRQRYWFTPPAAPTSRSRVEPGSDASSVPPGRRWRSPALSGTVFELELHAEAPAFLADHVVCGAPLVPATAMLELVRSASAGVFGAGAREVGDVRLVAALPVVAEAPTRVQIHVSPAGEVHLYSTRDADGPWQLHTTATLVETEGPALDVESLAEARARCRTRSTAAEHYAHMAARGLAYGPTFRVVEQLWCADREAVGQLDGTRAAAWGPGVAPGLLDGVLQVAGAVLPTDATNDEDDAHIWLPVGLERYWLARDVAPQELWTVVRARPEADSHHTSASSMRFDVQAFDADGTPWVEFRGLEVQRTSRAMIEAQSAPRQSPELAQTIRWVPTDADASDPPDAAGGRRWLIVADEGGLGSALAQALAAAGEVARLVADASPDLAQSATDRHPHLTLEQTRAELAHQLAEAPVDEVVYLRGLDIPPSELATGPLTDGQHRGLGGALALAQVLSELSVRAPRLVLVTRGAQPVSGVERVALEQASLWGFGATLQVEQPALRATLIDLDPFAAATPAGEAAVLVRELLARRTDARRGLRTGGVFVPRLVPLPSNADSGAPRNSPVRLRTAARGVLDRLRLEPMAPKPPSAGEVQVAVRAAGLNFRDVLNALGQYPGEPGELGDECAGVVTAVGPGVLDLRVGDRVMGMAAGSLASSVTVSVDFLCQIPQSLSFRDAATVPIAFLTAHYALNHTGGLRPQQRVLIHAAAGGVGLAAVQLAQRAGAEVFATAGSPAKRAFLRRLGVQHVFDSRSLSFADDVRAATGGAGVDLVLNSLAGEFIPASLDLVRAGGHFLEIGKLGTWSTAAVAARCPALAYSVIFLGDLQRTAPTRIRQMLAELAGWLESGELHPLPQRTFAFDAAAEAFHYMAQARQTGKVVLVPSAERPTPTVRSDATYLITGGTGGIGQHLARWLVDRGARYLALVSRTGESAATGALRAELEAEGAHVSVEALDVTHPGALEGVLGRLDARAWPPLGGVVHAAGTHDDGVLAQQRWSRFEGVLGSKLDGAWQLHQATRDLPLDFFVLCSSAAGVIGSAAQSSYAAANSWLDALAQYRQALGLPALSLDWGAWESTGMTASLGRQEQSRWTRRGLVALRVNDALGVFGAALSQREPQVVVSPLDPSAVPVGDPLAALVVDLTRADTAPSEPMGSRQPTFLECWASTPAARRRALLVDLLQREVARVLGLPTAQSIAPRQALNDLGLDSLTAVELRNALAAALETTLPATLLFDYPTPETLVDFLLAAVPVLETAASISPAVAAHLATRSSRDVSDREPAPDLPDLETLSEADAEALLLAELDLIRGQR